MNTIRFSSAVSVDKGLVRSNNEDNFYYGGKFLTAENRDDSHTFSVAHAGEVQVFGVFDGMGGEALGEEASYIAAETVSRYHQNIMVGIGDINASICRSVQEANTMICRKIQENGGKRIGATYSVLVIDDDKATVYNVGDSRIYMLRNGELRQLSVDDTMSQQLINIGIITPEQAKTHKDRHKLTQHLGIFQEEMIIEPHIMQGIEIKKGDKFLLCSDGLTDMLTDEEICAILATDKNCDELSKDLVNAALKNGGKDNVTTLVVRADSEKALPNMPAYVCSCPQPIQNKKSGFGAKPIIAFLCVLLALCIGVGAFLLISNINDRSAGSKGENSGMVDKLSDDVKADMEFADDYDKIKLNAEGVFAVDVNFETEDKNVVYVSSNPEVITVDEAGAYKALCVGESTITATCGEKSCSIEVEVYLPVEKLEVKDDIKLKVGEKLTIKYIANPKNHTEVIEFLSENVDVAKVSDDGEITAIAPGTTKIILSSHDCSAEVNITVEAKQTQPQNPLGPSDDPENKDSEDGLDKKFELPKKNNDVNDIFKDLDVG